MALQLARWHFNSHAEALQLARGGQRREDCGSALGIAFDTMSPVDRAILRASLHGLPPPVPRRHRRMDYASTIGALR